MGNEIIEQVKDFTTQWIFAQYEAGKPVSDIAAEIGWSMERVYAKMRVCPKTYEEIKRVREEMHCRRLRRVRGMADEMVLDYLERLHAKRKKAKNAKAVAAIDEQIEKVLKIAKQYADRVQLAEGKATANIGNAGGLPFKITVTETVENETTEDAEATEK